MVDPIDSPPSPTVESRDARGRFQPGHQVALQHGLTVDRVPAEFAHLRAELDAFVAGCLADEGVTPAEVSTRRRALLEDLARLRRRIMQLDTAIEARGMFDGHGRLRATWLERLTTMVKQAAAIDAQLGQERRTARSLTFRERLNEIAQRRPQAVTDEPGRHDVDPVNPERSEEIPMNPILIIGADQQPLSDLQLASSEERTVSTAPVKIDNELFALAVVTVVGPPIAVSFRDDGPEYVLDGGTVMFVLRARSVTAFTARAAASADASRIRVDYYESRRPATPRRAQAGA